MLYEIKHVKQDQDNLRKRWFTDSYFDLFVWYKKDTNRIEAFQLSYDKSYNERALTWKRKGGFMHTRVDDGETNPVSQMSPILVSDGIFDNQVIAEQFRKAAVNIDSSAADFVYKKIEEFPPDRF